MMVARVNGLANTETAITKVALALVLSIAGLQILTEYHTMT
jgi:hypothetical protein